MEIYLIIKRNKIMQELEENCIKTIKKQDRLKARAVFKDKSTEIKIQHGNGCTRSTYFPRSK